MTRIYKIVRKYRDHHLDSHIVTTGLTLEQAQAHCCDPETSSNTATSDEARKLTARMGPWFDCYYEQED